MFGYDISEIRSTIKTTAIDMLENASSESDIADMMSEVHRIAEDKVRKILPSAERKNIDCKKGCSICCRVNVAILPPEAVLIKNHLLSQYSAKDIESLVKKMDELVTHIKYLDEVERIFANKPCVFLDEDGGCGIYHVRPLLCRSVTSADVSACSDAMTLIALDESPFVPMNIKQKSIMDAAFKAVADALEEKDLDSSSIELTSHVLSII